MGVTPLRHRITPVPTAFAAVAGAGAAAALLATYWDDSWHTDRGRDEFAIPPHLLLYGGVLLAALAVSAWGLLAWLRAGGGRQGLRAALADPALLLAGVGGVATLASAPVDAAWHGAYGRDAVIWSPPHLAAVLGTLGLSVGLLAGLGSVPGPGARLARLLAAAGVIGTLQVPVLEYDSDVPQFPVVWFLPVAALGVCVAAALLDDLLPASRDVTAAALVYTLLRAGTAAFLAVTGFSLSAVPPVVVLFAAHGLLRGRSSPVRLVAVGAAAPLVWWPFLQLQGDVATVVPASLLPSSVALGAAAGAAVALAHGDLRPRLRSSLRAAAALTGLTLAALVLPGQQAARAHDPGQGEQIRQGVVTVSRSAGDARIVMALDRPCAGLLADATTARRAGQVRSGPLRVGDTAAGCRLEGAVAGLRQGRWFVYAQVRDAEGRALEAWLPVAADSTSVQQRPLYAVPAAAGTGANAAGAALLGGCAALVIACLRLARRAGRPAPQPVEGVMPMMAS